MIEGYLLGVIVTAAGSMLLMLYGLIFKSDQP